MTPAVRALLVGSALLPVLSACHSWRPATAAPAVVVEAERPPVVRVTRASGDVVTLRAPTLVADSIVGSTGTGDVRTATSDVRLLEVQSFSVPKTLALLVTHVSAVVSFIALVIDLQPHYRF